MADLIRRYPSRPKRAARHPFRPERTAQRRRRGTGFSKAPMRYCLPAILALVFVLLLSSGIFSYRNTGSLINPILSYLAPEIQPEEVVQIHSWIRKVGHFTEYFILGLLLMRGFRGALPGTCCWQRYLLAAAVLLLWAAGDEFLQSFTPERSPSALDVAIDAAGGVLALWVTALRSLFDRSGRKRSPRTDSPPERPRSAPFLHPHPLQNAAVSFAPIFGIQDR